MAPRHPGRRGPSSTDRAPGHVCGPDDEPRYTPNGLFTSYGCPIHSTRDALQLWKKHPEWRKKP